MRTPTLILSAALLALSGCQKDGEVQSTADAEVDTVTVAAVEAEPDYSWTYWAFYPVDDVEVPTTIGDIKDNADAWHGKDIEGRVKVLTVPTDRGFWIEGPAGDKMFALIKDAPRDEWKDITPGQTLYLLEARVYGPEHTTKFDTDKEPLTKASSDIMKDESAYLVVDETDLVIFPN